MITFRTCSPWFVALVGAFFILLLIESANGHRFLGMRFKCTNDANGILANMFFLVPSDDTCVPVGLTSFSINCESTIKVINDTSCGRDPYQTIKTGRCELGAVTECTEFTDTEYLRVQTGDPRSADCTGVLSTSYTRLNKCFGLSGMPGSDLHERRAGSVVRKLFNNTDCSSSGFVSQEDVPIDGKCRSNIKMSVVSGESLDKSSAFQPGMPTAMLLTVHLIISATIIFQSF